MSAGVATDIIGAAATINQDLRSWYNLGYSTYQDQRNYNQSVKQYNQQYALQKDALYNGYQIKAQDMAKAGLNPILAGSGSGSSTSQVSTSGGSSLASDSGSSILGYLSLKQQNKQFYDDLELRKQQNSVERAKARAQVIQSLAQTNLTNAQIEQVLEQMGLIKAQKENVEQSTQNLQASLNQINAQIESLKIQNVGAVTDNQIKEVQKAMMESQLTFDEFERRFWQMAGIPQSAASTLAGSNVGAGVLSGVLTIAGLANKAEADNIADGIAAKAELEELKKKISPLENTKRSLSSSEKKALKSLQEQRSLLLQKVEKAKKSWNTRQSHFKTGSDL